jgi:hypothetical protein
MIAPVLGSFLSGVNGAGREFVLLFHVDLI